MGNFLKPLLKIYINRISWITCSDASTLFDYSIVDPGFTQGTANLQLGGWVGEKCSLFDPVSAVKSHYWGNCFCSTLISYQLGLGMCSFGFVSKWKEPSTELDQNHSAAGKNEQIFQSWLNQYWWKQLKQPGLYTRIGSPGELLGAQLPPHFWVPGALQRVRLLRNPGPAHLPGCQIMKWRCRVCPTSNRGQEWDFKLQEKIH